MTFLSTFCPIVSQSFGDGSLANLPWMQELPDVLTTAMWSSWVEINPKTGAAVGHSAGRSGGDRVAAGKLACCRDSFAGNRARHGRHAGRPGTRKLRPVCQRPRREPTLDSRAAHRTRNRIAGLGRDARETDAGGRTRAGQAHIVRGRNERLPPRRGTAVVFAIWNAPRRAEEGNNKFMAHKWGLVVDLDRCTGCEACVVACHAENNIPTAGADQAARGRTMQWIRVERYWEGDFPNPQSPLSAGPLPAMRRGTLRACLPHLRQLSHGRGAERPGLQPLHRHALLRQCLPVQRALLQFLQSGMGHAAEPAAQSRCFRAQRGHYGEVHLLRAAHQVGGDPGRSGKARSEGWRVHHGLRAILRVQGAGLRRSE